MPADDLWAASGACHDVHFDPPGDLAASLSEQLAISPLFPEPCGGSPDLQPHFPEASYALLSDAIGARMPPQPCLPEASVHFPDSSAMHGSSASPSCTSSHCVRQLQDQENMHDDVLGFGTSAVAVSCADFSAQSLQQHSRTLTSLPSFICDENIPEPCEEDSALRRFMDVMAERQNSVDLPPCLSEEEWSSAMPASSSCGGLSSLGASPFSKWGSRKLLDASPKAQECQ